MSGRARNMLTHLFLGKRVCYNLDKECKDDDGKSIRVRDV